MRYPHLKLTDWPFRVVPPESFYSFIADRDQLAKDVADFLRNVSRREASSMHLMWAWYGAGKTHTLRHIEYQCRAHFPALVPVYSEFPKTARGFPDLYRLFISRIDLDQVGAAYEEVFTNPEARDTHRALLFDSPDLVTALRKLLGGTEQEQILAIRWLRMEVHELRALKTIGISRPLVSAEQAIQIISWLIRLLDTASRLRSGDLLRVIWMLDEYQRIRECRGPAQVEINGCVHSLFNRSPNGLTILISFTGRPEEKKLPSWLSPEVKDRIGIEKVFLLPPLSDDEALRFVADLLTHFRNPSGSKIVGLYPFTPDSVREVLQAIKEKSEMKPRSIMQFFNAVLEEAEPEIEAGRLGEIEPAFAKQVLRDRSIVDEQD